MSVHTDVHMLGGSRDLTGEGNELALTMGEQTHEHSPFGNEGVERELGRPSDAMKFMGVYSAAVDGSFDDRTQEMLQTIKSTGAAFPFLASLENNPGVAGDFCVFNVCGGIGSFETPVKGGDLRRFEVSAGASGPIVTGKLLHVGQINATSGTGTETTLPAVTLASGKKFAALLLGYEAASGDLDIVIESAADAAFTSPTDRITFSTLSTATHERLEFVPDANVTDTYWRIKWTGSGSPDLSLGVAIGVV